MIEVTEIRKSYGAVQAVQGISFSIKTGEVVGLLGPNGAGKSTTMRMITGFLTADHGTITVEGINVADDPLGARARIGYLPESAPLYLDMEVTDFLRYIAALRRVQKNVVTGRVRDMVDVCGLGSVVGRPIGELSKGYRQRVGLAAAMLHQPSVLILDEPTSGLDPNQIQEIRAVIRELGRMRTVILSTHILQEVEAVCHRALIINKGQLVGQGSLTELMAQGHSQVRYHVLVNAAETALRDRAGSLAGVNLVACHAASTNWREAVFESTTTKPVSGEAIFQWTVANGWQLRELRRESASLEDVFRELTQ